MNEESPKRVSLPERPVRILFLENDVADLELCRRALTNANLEFQFDPSPCTSRIRRKAAQQAYDVFGGLPIREMDGD